MELGATKIIEPAVEEEEAIPRSAVTDAILPSPKEKKVLHPSTLDLYNPPLEALQLEGYQVYISSVNSPSDFLVQMKAGEDLIYGISSELEQYVEDGAAVVERPVVDQLYVMEHPNLGGFHRVRITQMDGDAVEIGFVEYGEVHSIQTPRIYELPEHLKELPFLAARCSMKREKWTPEAQDRFMTVTSDQTSLFRAVFGPVKKDGTLQIVSLFQDGKNIEDVIFAGLCEDSLMSIAVQEPVFEKVSTSDITEPANVDGIEEEPPSSLVERAVELVNEHSTPDQPVGASSIVIEEGEVSDPADASPVLLTQSCLADFLTPDGRFVYFIMSTVTRKESIICIPFFLQCLG